MSGARKMMVGALVASGVVVLLATGVVPRLGRGCGGCGPDGDPGLDAVDGPDLPVGTKEVGDTGTIRGVVRFEGRVPERRVLDVTSDDVCHAAHDSAPLLADDVVVNPDGTLRWVVASVRSEQVADYRLKRPKDEVEIDQVGCRYEPHVASVMSGQRIVFKNSDRTTHNVHAMPEADGNAPFNEMAKAGSSPIIKRYKTHEYVRVKCDVHPWMESFVAVFPHPFHAVTGDAGAFEIAGVPVGEYDLDLWHQVYGKTSVEVTVQKDAVAEVEVVYSPGG